MSVKEFKNVKESVDTLTTNMQKLIVTLQKDSERKAALRQLENPTAEFNLVSLPATGKVDELMSPIALNLENIGEYEHLMINEFLPKDRIDRHWFLQALKKQGIGSSAMLYSCTHRGNLENLHFIWKVTGNVEYTLQAQTIEKLKKEIPQFHSRLVKKVFSMKAQKLNIDPKYARFLYKIATEDASAPENCKVDAIDRRVMTFVETGDPDIVVDLRLLHRNPLSYESFFSLTADVIEETVGTAVDDRRHTAVVHLAAAMSAADLYRYAFPI